MSRAAATDLGRSLQLARTGNWLAARELLDDYRNYLNLLARLQVPGRLRNAVDAADWVRRTLLDAHRDFGSFRGNTEAELVGWLRGILVRNLVHARRRYLGTHHGDIDQRELALDLGQSSAAMGRFVPAPQSAPGRGTAGRQRSVLLADALQHLPDEYREAIVMRQLEGLGFADIALCLDCSVDHAKKLWVQGLEQLHRALRDIT